MSNRETYPASQSPLLGDINGPAGATSVTVVGIQGNPVQNMNPLPDQAQLTWDVLHGQWEPDVEMFTVRIGGSPDIGGILVGWTIISKDWIFTVNGVGFEVLANWPYGFSGQVFVNGVKVAGS